MGGWREPPPHQSLASGGNSPTRSRPLSSCVQMPPMASPRIEGAENWRGGGSAAGVAVYPVSSRDPEGRTVPRRDRELSSRPTGGRGPACSDRKGCQLIPSPPKIDPLQNPLKKEEVDRGEGSLDTACHFRTATQGDTSWLAAHRVSGDGGDGGSISFEKPPSMEATPQGDIPAGGGAGVPQPPTHEPTGTGRPVKGRGQGHGGLDR